MHFAQDVRERERSPRYAPEATRHELTGDESPRELTGDCLLGMLPKPPVRASEQKRMTTHPPVGFLASLQEMNLLPQTHPSLLLFLFGSPNIRLQGASTELRAIQCGDR